MDPKEIERRRAAKARAIYGEPEPESPVVEEAPAVDTAGIPQEALEDRARQLGVSVSDLTSDQIEEVRASLAAEEPAPKARGSRRRAKPEE